MINSVLINFKQLDLILTFKEFATTGPNRVKTTGIRSKTFHEKRGEKEQNRVANRVTRCT